MSAGKSVAVFGTFDGLHKGHRAVLNAALAFEDLKPVVITFDEPPKRYFSGGNTPMLMTSERKVQELKNNGFDVVEVLDFDSIKDMSAKDFLDLMFQKFQIKVAVCGFNFRFGKGAEGNAEFLNDYCRSHGAEAVVCPPMSVSGQEVSSTLIRELIADGNIGFANLLLGEPFSFKTMVEHGDERGRTLGFPTINQQLQEELVVPKFGVYATAVIIDKKCYAGVTNIGVRPTYLLKKPQSETYISGFSGDLYGQKVEIKLLSFLREEIQFGSAEELKNAIAADEEQALKSFTLYSESFNKF